MRVAILGCGYVGLALGTRLRGDHEVFGIRRSADGLAAVEDAGLTPVEADLTDRAQLDSLPGADAVVFAASAGGRDVEAARETYVDAQRTVIDVLGRRDSPPARYVYTSSTGVYGDHGGDWVDEETSLDPATPRQRVLAEAESIALETPADVGMSGTVVRLAGLYGPDRYRLDRYLEGPVTEGVLNLCHRRDAAGALAHLLESGQGRGEVVTVVDDEPVAKWTLADWLAEACGVPAPPKQTVAAALEAGRYSEAAAERRRASKRCANDKLRSLGYEPAVPTFREGYRPAVRAFRNG